jgi:hypothetical protein
MFVSSTWQILCSYWLIKRANGLQLAHSQCRHFCCSSHIMTVHGATLFIWTVTNLLCVRVRAKYSGSSLTVVILIMESGRFSLISDPAPVLTQTKASAAPANSGADSFWFWTGFGLVLDRIRPSQHWPDRTRILLVKYTSQFHHY